MAESRLAMNGSWKSIDGRANIGGGEVDLDIRPRLN